MRRPKKGRPLLVLVDGHSLLHRAFYALPPLTSDDGQPTNAIHGFFNMLLRLLRELSPEFVAVAMDAPGPTFRHVKYEKYKAHRPDMHDDLRSQVPLLKELLEALNIAVIEVQGFEADDILGSLARKGDDPQLGVLMVTGDKDALQLVKPGVEALFMRRGITDFVYFDRDKILEDYQLEPHLLLDVKALQGDASDNIPGVPGVGEKTALRLVRQFGPLERVLESIDQVRGKKLPQVLEEYREQALLSKELACIDTDMRLDVDMEQLKLRLPRAPEVRDTFLKYGLKSVLERLPSGREVRADPGAASLGVKARLVLDAAGLRESVSQLKAQGRPLGLWALMDSHGPVGVGLSLSEEVIWCWLSEISGHGDLSGDDILGALADILRSTDGVVSHEFKPVAVALGDSNAVSAGDLRSVVNRALRFDCCLAAYLLDPSRSEYSLSGLARHYLDMDVPSRAEFFGRGKKAVPPGEVPGQRLAAFFGARAEAARRLPEAMEPDLEARGLTPLLSDMEMPLLPILAAMEVRGIGIDVEALGEMGETISQRARGLEREIYSLAGQEFNLNSPQQLSRVLFEDLGLPPVKKTKTGYSTDAEVLERLASEHPVPDKILEHRSLVKILGTYVEGLKSQVSPRTGRVHTTFNQTVTATGRLSAADPNLQNIPVREQTGRLLRKAFVADEGCRLVAADYSQIELRILAHLSEDPGLIEAFRRGVDIHTATAREVFGAREVSTSMRDAAKAVNFGIIYGISGFGLARNLGIPQSEAEEYIQAYFSRYPGVRRYMKESVHLARQRGYASTLYGRMRFLPDLNSRNWHRRSLAERMAMNTPIQGTAADIIKKAMIEVQGSLDEADIEAAMLLQVHDELIFEVQEEQTRALTEMVRSVMENVVELLVPLKVDTGAGASWYDVKGG